MSASAIPPIAVNVLAVAQRILNSPTGMEETSEVELVALACFVLTKNDLPEQWPEWPLYGRAIKASLLASVARVITAHDAASATRAAVKASAANDDALLHRLADQADQFHAALKTLKTLFSQEFPTNGNR